MFDIDKELAKEFALTIYDQLIIDIKATEVKEHEENTDNRKDGEAA